MPLSGLALNEARRRLIEMHYRAQVGHIGGNLSSIDVMMLSTMSIWRQDDRFVLSKGHSAGASLRYLMEPRPVDRQRSRSVPSG